MNNTGQRTLLTIWVSPFLVRSVQPMGDFEVILTVKMETTYPVGRPFMGREFSAFVIIAEL